MNFRNIIQKISMIFRIIIQKISMNFWIREKLLYICTVKPSIKYYDKARIREPYCPKNVQRQGDNNNRSEASGQKHDDESDNQGF